MSKIFCVQEQNETRRPFPSYTRPDLITYEHYASYLVFIAKANPRICLPAHMYLLGAYRCLLEKFWKLCPSQMFLPMTRSCFHMVALSAMRSSNFNEGT